MRNTLVVLIVLAITAVFYWQFLVPAPSPASEIDLSSVGASEDSAVDASAELDFVPGQ